MLLPTVTESPASSQPARYENFVDDSMAISTHPGDAMLDVRAARIFRQMGSAFCGRLFA